MIIEHGECIIISAHLDGSPEDCLSNNINNGEHTVVVVDRNNDVKEQIANEFKAKSYEVTLSKWHDVKRNRATASKYKVKFQKFIIELSLINRISISAFTFKEHFASELSNSIAQKSNLAQFMSEHYEKNQESYISFSFPYKQPYIISKKQSDYLFMLYEIIMTYWYCAKNQIQKENNVPVVLDLCIDKISGDSVQKHRRAQLLKEMLDIGSGGWVILSMNEQSDEKAGDLIADNIAGWFNSALKNPTSLSAGAARILLQFGISIDWKVILNSQTWGFRRKKSELLCSMVKLSNHTQSLSPLA